MPSTSIPAGRTRGRRTRNGGSKAGKKETRRKGNKKGKGNPRQLTIFDGQWGGAREGSGPKPKPGAGVPHDRREQFHDKPVHVTLPVDPGLRGLRHKAESEALRRAMEAGKERDGFRLVQYSIEWNHLHLMVEARNAEALSVGMKGLCVRIARALNRLWKRRGRVFTDRYHAHVLHGPILAGIILRYILCNGRKHGAHIHPGPDPYSSGPAYRDWSDRTPELATPDPCILEARHYFLTEGWRMHCTPFSTDHVPPSNTNPRSHASQRKAERRHRRSTA